jgi:inorganic pyrophosphatase
MDGDSISAGADKDVAHVVLCVVEIPKGSRNKYEYDPEYGGIKLDRFISSALVYPTDYGFIPETLSGDGDALDAMVCVSEPTFPGCLVPAKPIGLFEMEDEAGIDNTVLCVPCQDPGWNEFERVEDLPRQLRNEITHFFSVYKDLEPGKRSVVKGWRDREAAVREIEADRARFRGHEGVDSASPGSAPTARGFA